MSSNPDAVVGEIRYLVVRFHAELGISGGSVSGSDVLYRTLEEAIAAGEKNITINEDITLNSSVTIPEGTTLTIANGATLTLGQGVTLTNNGLIDAKEDALNDDAGTFTCNHKNFVWRNDADSHWPVCLSCYEIFDNEAPHDFVWHVDVEPTETEAGLGHEECSICHFGKFPVEIPATGTTDSEKPTDPSSSEDASENPTESNKPEGTASDSSEGTTNTDNVQTSDNSNMALWISLFAAAGIVLMGTIVCGKKRKYNH